MFYKLAWGLGGGDDNDNPDIERAKRKTGEITEKAEELVRPETRGKIFKATGLIGKALTQQKNIIGSMKHLEGADYAPADSAKFHQRLSNIKNMAQKEKPGLVAKAKGLMEGDEYISRGGKDTSWGGMFGRLSSGWARMKSHLKQPDSYAAKSND